MSQADKILNIVYTHYPAILIVLGVLIFFSASAKAAKNTARLIGTIVMIVGILLYVF